MVIDPFETGGDVQKNRQKGMSAEEQARQLIASNGYTNIHTVHTGADYKAECVMTGRTEYFEIKSGDASLSEAQKEKRRKEGPERYHVIRFYEPIR